MHHEFLQAILLTPFSQGHRYLHMKMGVLSDCLSNVESKSIYHYAPLVIDVHIFIDEVHAIDVACIC
jgi:hypothetical protein